MKKTVPIRFLVDDMCDTLFRGNPQHIPDVTRATGVILKAACKVHFLTVPNLQRRNWFEDAVGSLDAKLELQYGDRWFISIHRYCMRWLAAHFKRWDEVTLSVRADIAVFNNRGDYRIKKYHELFGCRRIGDEELEEIKPLVVPDLTDPFYVSDVVECDQSEEAYNVTATPMVSAFSEVPDYLRLERDGAAIKGLRGLPRDHLLRAKAVADSKPVRISRDDRRRVGESEQEWLQRMGEQGKKLLARHLSSSKGVLPGN